MQGFWGFWGDVVSDFMQQSPVNQVAIVVGVGGVILFPIGGWLRSYLRIASHDKIVSGLKHEVIVAKNEAKAANKKAEDEEAFASQWVPQRWLDAAIREREQGNEELAVGHLEVGFDNVRSDLSLVVKELAEYGAVTIAETDQGSFSAAKRMARLAWLLSPEGFDDAELLDEILMQEGDAELRSGDLSLITHLPSDPEAAEALIDAIIDKVKPIFDAGHYLLACELYRRGTIVAKRAGIYDHYTGCSIRYREVQALSFAGNATEAFERMTALLPIQERESGAEHPNTLATRHLEAQLLRDIGKEAEALEKVTALLPVMERENGAEHPGVLSTRHLEAELLWDIGKVTEALERVTALLPVMEREIGAEHPDVLSTRHLEVDLLRDIGKEAEALEKVTALLSVLEREIGAEHPNTLPTRHLEAEILRDAGKAAEALEKVRALLLVMERVEGAEHPNVLPTRRLEVELLKDTGKATEALEKVTVLLPVMERESGVEHPNTLFTRRLEAEVLRDAGKAAEALEKVVALVPDMERVEGAEHSNTLYTCELMARLHIDLGEIQVAKEIAERILPLQIAEMSEAHWHVRETRALLDEIEQLEEGD